MNLNLQALKFKYGILNLDIYTFEILISLCKLSKCVLIMFKNHKLNVHLFVQSRNGDIVFELSICIDWGLLVDSICNQKIKDHLQKEA